MLPRAMSSTPEPPPPRPKRRRLFRTPPALKRWLRSPRAQEALARTVSAYLALCYRSMRWEFHGFDHLAHSTREQKSGLVCFWHERLALMPMLAIEARRQGATHPTDVLGSGHRDGRFMATVIAQFGLGTVIGSSSKGGAAGLRHMLLLIRDGHNIAITPDGPRGPARRAAAGIAQLAGATGAPIYPTAGQCRFHLRLGSWDRMVLPLPLPFGRAVIAVEPPIWVPRGGAEAALPRIEAALDAACAAADRALGLEPRRG
ncbi:lysophospholipid acyltransferase family protein [Acidisoma sp. C75]